MGKTTFTALIAAFVGVMALTLSVPAEAGRGHGNGWKGSGNRYVQNNYYGRGGGYYGPVSYTHLTLPTTPYV